MAEVSLGRLAVRADPVVVSSVAEPVLSNALDEAGVVAHHGQDGNLAVVLIDGFWRGQLFLFLVGFQPGVQVLVDGLPGVVGQGGGVQR